MRQVTVVLTCDACMAWKEREVAEGVATVPVSGHQTLDLCPEHTDALRRVWALVAEWGVDGTTAPTRRRTASRRSATNGSASATPPAGADHPTDDAPETAPTAPRNRRGGKRARARREGSQGPRTAAPGSFSCPLCDATPANAASLSAHVRTQHHTTASEVYGSVCPVCDHTSATGRALGIHARTAHDITTGVPGLFAEGTVQGDPYGVIASRAAAFGKAANA
jgi:hypothetical protein